MNYKKYRINNLNFESIKNLNYKEYKKNIGIEYYPEFDKGNRLEFSNFNLFIGTNGGGKSTVLDIINAIKTTNFKFLRRENIGVGSISRLIINDGEFLVFLGENNYKLFNNSFIEIKSNYDGIIQSLKIGGKDIDNIPINSNKIDFNLELIENYKGESLTSSMVYDTIVNLPKMFEKSIFLGMNYTGSTGITCFENDEKVYEKNLVKLFFKTEHNLQENGYPYYGNIIDIKELPSGWKQVIWILSLLEKTINGSIILLEEPEIHLNAKNQRYLIDKIIEICNKKDLQLFMTTHSSSFINLSINKDFSLFNCDGKTIHKENIYSKLLDNLGVKGSDLLQTNCVIWVEGPSDRIYIKNWLNLYSLEKTHMIEDIDYSFAFYGGSILNHFNGERDVDIEDSISIFKINRNSIIIMDSDLDFCWENGMNQVLNKNKGKTKLRIRDECENGGGHVWITQYYTIENYLPNLWKQENLYLNDFETPYREDDFFKDISNSRILLNKKVDKSIKFFEGNIKTFDDSYDLKTNLKDEIEKIYSLILNYNK